MRHDRPTIQRLRPLLAGAALLSAAACAQRTIQLAPGAGVVPAGAPMSTTTSAGTRYVYTPADVAFMQGMIPHHAQAVRMATLAPTHSASRAVLLLAERIIVSQDDEIEMMRTWLAERNERVPAADATHHRMSHGGMEHDMLMPGMLTDEELAQLALARGVEFDRLFLVFMIRHHQGALTMVNELFSSPGAAHDDVIYTFASDVWADQTSEIDRMEKLLASLPSGSSAR